MPPKITKVRWSASDLPWGISFDEKDGTFSGTPTDPGEYTVPVKVETNYGQDQKDVQIVVDNFYGDVYALGDKAKQWSGDAEADSYGLRKLPMPQASRLVSLYYGFAGKCEGGKWYTCATNTCYLGLNTEKVTELKAAGIDVSKPFEYPVSNIIDVASCSKSINSTGDRRTYFAYLTASNDCHEWVGLNSQSPGETVYSRVVKLSNDQSYVVLRLTNNNTLVGGGASIPIEYAQVKKFMMLYSNVNAITVLTKDGKAYINYATPIEFSAGKITDIYKGAKHTVYVMTDKDEVYGLNYNFNENVNKVTAQEKIWDGKVSKILPMGANGDFLLTSNGELYYRGTTIPRLITSRYDVFTRIFPDYEFGDIAFCNLAGTLVFTIRK